VDGRPAPQIGVGIGSSSGPNTPGGRMSSYTNASSTKSFFNFGGGASSGASKANSVGTPVIGSRKGSVEANGPQQQSGEGEAEGEGGGGRTGGGGGIEGMGEDGSGGGVRHHHHGSESSRGGSDVHYKNSTASHNSISSERSNYFANSDVEKGGRSASGSTVQTYNSASTGTGLGGPRHTPQEYLHNTDGAAGEAGGTVSPKGYGFRGSEVGPLSLWRASEADRIARDDRDEEELSLTINSESLQEFDGNLSLSSRISFLGKFKSSSSANRLSNLGGGNGSGGGGGAVVDGGDPGNSSGALSPPLAGAGAGRPSLIGAMKSRLQPVLFSIPEALSPPPAPSSAQYGSSSSVASTSSRGGGGGGGMSPVISTTKSPLADDTEEEKL
jgi:hypothetical protein